MVPQDGQVIKRMLTRFDQEKPIETPEDFDVILCACFQAKNSLMRHKGYSPEQIVLGKSVKLPASLTSDENMSAHALALGEGPESESFLKQLEIRTIARKSFLLTDNDNAFRRALLGRPRPLRGPFSPNQLVMYWLRRPRANRSEGGRWHGPAKVLWQEGPTAVWITHANRLFKVAPESLRAASLREWQSVHGPDFIPEPESAIEHDPLQNVAASNSPDDLVYSPSAPPSPGSPVGSHNAPTSSAGQPESEIIPDDTRSHEVDPQGPPEIESGVDVPVPDSENSDLDEPAHLILSCAEVPSENPASTIFDWTTLESGETTHTVLLAEDGLPYIDDVIECTDEQCFMLDIPIHEQDIHKWHNDPKPEEFAWVASATKRARSEVSVKSMTLEDRILFDQAKDAELNCWLQTSALKPILRRALNPDQILKSRWVLTWKEIDDPPPGSPNRKAKARLVVLGFQDPKLTDVARDSPTLTREGRHTVLQTIASQKWLLSSFDIKTAFLRGQADSKNPLAMEPPPELKKKLNLTEQQVCALVGNAYGRVDAPLLFYKELTRQFKNLNFTTHPLEPCIHYLESFTNGKRCLHGVVGTHVDDGICGGDEYFHKQLELLKTKLPFGSFKQRKFTFTGIALEQMPDFSIVASQEEYVRRIPNIDIGRHRRSTPDSSVTDAELNKLRGLIGSLQYAVSNTRPDMASKLGEIQTQVAKANVQTLLSANKVLREAQETSDVHLCFRHISPEAVTHVSFGDASFASAKQLSSFQGTLICATTPELDQNKVAAVSPLTWTSKKIARVVRSTLSAEAFSMSNSVDRLGWMRLLWGTIIVPDFNWREPPKGFLQLPIATVVTDCKSLFDLVTRTAMPSCEEFRTTLEVLLIKERASEHVHFRWIPTALQVADALTKPMDPILLRKVLATGRFQLFDEEASLERNAHRKQAVQWLSPKVTST